MDYWKSVLDEVLNKNDPNFEFQYTTLREGRKPLRLPRHRAERHLAPTRQAYPLGSPYEEIYFTPREAECYYYFSKGHTIATCARAMGLSPRTVEFYVRNMKLKLKVDSKSELIDLLSCTDLAQRVAHFGEQEKAS